MRQNTLITGASSAAHPGIRAVVRSLDVMSYDDVRGVPVTIASMSAMRGMKKNLTTYAAQ